MLTKTRTFSFGTYLCTFCLSPIIFSLWQKMVHHNFTDVRTCPCSLPSLIRGKSIWLYGMLFQISLVLRLLLKLKSLKSFFKRYRKFIAKSLWLKNHKSEYYRNWIVESLPINYWSFVQNFFGSTNTFVGRHSKLSLLPWKWNHGKYNKE